MSEMEKLAIQLKDRVAHLDRRLNAVTAVNAEILTALRAVAEAIELGTLPTHGERNNKLTAMVRAAIKKAEGQS